MAAPMKRCAFGLLILLMGSFLLPPTLHAQELSTPAKIKRQLQEWSRRLNNHSKEKDRLATLIWNLDTAIAEQEDKTKKTNDAVLALEQERKTTQQAIERLKKSQSKLLSTYLQSLNLQAHFEKRRYIPLVTSPLRTEERRLMQYYAYYQSAINEKLQQQASECEELVVLNAQLSQEQLQNRSLLEQQESQLAHLKQLQDQRTQILNELQASFVAEKKQVSHLQAKLEELNQSLIASKKASVSTDDISEEMESVLQPSAAERRKEKLSKRQQAQLETAEKLDKNRAPTHFGPKTAFKSLKGRLSWPLAHHHPVIEKDPVHPGTRLIAPAGTPVRAIHHGTVVFADTLKGLGLLVIVDHGHGYMSLYGDNESLYVKTGDVIKANDLLGRVGTPGTVNHSSLYLEIRKDGKPLNVASWFLP